MAMAVAIAVTEVSETRLSSCGPRARRLATIRLNGSERAHNSRVSCGRPSAGRNQQWASRFNNHTTFKLRCLTSLRLFVAFLTVFLPVQRLQIANMVRATFGFRILVVNFPAVLANRAVGPTPDLLAQERAEHLLLFNLLGDPLLRLHHPKEVEITAASTIDAGRTLELTGQCPTSGRCTIELVCRRDRINGLDVAVDVQGAAYIVGQPFSVDDTFPRIVGPDLTFNGGRDDAFVSKVSPDGSRLATGAGIYDRAGSELRIWEGR